MTPQVQTAKTTAALRMPSQWPDEVTQIYEPLRTLGEGSFASVMLARRRKNGHDTDDDHHEDNPQQLDTLVAIKIVGSQRTTMQEAAYAHREVEILEELRHPNIIRLIHHWEPSAHSHTCAGVMALAYVRGPTLHALLNRGGKLSLVFCRIVAAQLVEAISYCHYRAVVHRDIKPDNILISGATMLEAGIWDDDIVTEPTNGDDWKRLRERWHLTLIDFGFARALTPEDMKKVPPRPKKLSPATKKKLGNSNDAIDSSTGRSSLNMSMSMSRKLVRVMSAVGNLAYAAPEVHKDVQETMEKKNPAQLHRPMSDYAEATTAEIDVTDTFSAHVSFYGLMADAYSVGKMILHMMTGVRPDQNVDDVIAASQAFPLVVLCSFVCRTMCCNKKKATTTSGTEEEVEERTVEYRRVSAIPGEVRRLIRGLTHPDVHQRTSIRTARRYPWIDDVQVDVDASCWVGAADRKTLDFLSFAVGSSTSNSSTKKNGTGDEHG